MELLKNTTKRLLKEPLECSNYLKNIFFILLPTKQYLNCHEM